jgi:hypothetical protein
LYVWRKRERKHWILHIITFQFAQISVVCFFEMHGLERFIRYQEGSFDWYANEIGLLYDELGIGVVDDEFEPREDEEIIKDIDNLEEERSILKNKLKN